jgi:membrane protein required for colicin V production
MSLAVIDIVFIALILILVVRCTLRGFVVEVMSMASLVLGVLGAIFFYKNGAVFVEKRFAIAGFPSKLLAFIGIFFVIFIMVKILEYILRDIINRINLGGVDRFLGFLFGLVEGTLLTALALFFLSGQPLFDAAPLLEKSLFARFLLPLMGVVLPAAGLRF